jgi:transcriptional antiterminator RfaH
MTREGCCGGITAHPEAKAIMSNCWYVLRSKPHKEDLLYHHALAQGFRIFYPWIEVQPYFPSYMFIQCDLSRVGSSTFRYMPHAVGLVSFDNEPASIDATVVEAIHERVALLNATATTTRSTLHAGDRVWISAGPFAGCEAIFDAQLSGSDRVRLLLRLLSERQVALEIEATHVQRCVDGTTPARPVGGG